ncbi:MAG: hypothetical protein AB8H80_13000 [Planctomycetota bacterium]
MAPPRYSPWLSYAAVVAATFAAAWGLWHWVLWQPDETTRLRDDAFYEFAWAANVAAGRGPTVSDGTTTSGVQLLWSSLLVPIAAIFGPAALPSLASALGLLLHVLNAGVWYLLGRGRIAGACLALCWLGHPLLLREAQNGQETALATLLATAVFGLRNARDRFYLPVSLLAVLARSDLAALAVLLALVRGRRRGYSWHTVAVVACLVVVPLGANALLGGGLMPDSAMPMSWLFHENLSQPAAGLGGLGDEAAGGFWQQQWWFARPLLLGGPFSTASAFGFGVVAFMLIRPWWPVALRAVPALLVGCASALGARSLLVPGWCALLLALFPALRVRRMSAERLAVVLGIVAIVALHWPLRWYPRDYYLCPLVVVAFAALGRFARLRPLLLVFAVAQVQDSWRIRPEPLRGQREMQLAGSLLHEVLPASERVGCFNSGLVTYWADVLASGGSRRGIVNLDGVVDHRSFAALREGRLSSWLDAQGVRFLLDNPVQFSRDATQPHACGRFFAEDFDAEADLVEVARFDVPFVHGSTPAGDSMRLYWRRGRGPQPAAAVATGEVRLLPACEVDGIARPPVVIWGARAGQSLALDGVPGAGGVLVADVECDTTVVLELPGQVLVDGQLAAGRLAIREK